MQSTGSAASLAHRPRHPVRGTVSGTWWPAALQLVASRRRCTAAAGANQGAVSLSFAAGGQKGDRLEPVLRARMLAGAATFFTVEAGTFEDYLPDEATLAAVATPR